MALGGAGFGDGRRGRRVRRKPLSEINVTPLVDVMLVLLIIFMISAPLLTVGVPLELPRTEANAVDTAQKPVTLSINHDGGLYLGDRAVEWGDLIAAVAQDTGADGRDTPVFIRADGRASYDSVARVMARLSSAGFTKLNLITDTGASTPAAAVDEPET